MRPTKELIKSAITSANRFQEIQDLKPLIERLGQAQVVMLGEASHGTHEYYEWRARISQELIANHGFSFIAVEGDWPPCHKANEYVKWPQPGQTARSVQTEFHRWPTWMWANTETEELLEWLKEWNQQQTSRERKVGFYGLDVYSLFESIEEVIDQVKRFDPQLADSVKERYACFDRFEEDEHAYARSLLRFPEGCQKGVLKALKELLQLRLNGSGEKQDALFDAQQNARIVKNAEDYYRTMVFGYEDSWNVRDRHMMETLDLLLQKHGPNAKAIVWEHNTHIGDYRATDMARMGQVNIGGLAREQYGEDKVALLGFGTYKGTVIASPSWGGPVLTLQVPPGKEDTYEDIFHRVADMKNLKQFYMVFDEAAKSGPLSDVRGHRAIGVVYDPRREKRGNYVPTSLSKRYDAFMFFDQTRALEPLKVPVDEREIPESYPSGV